MKRFLTVASIVMLILISGCRKDESSLAGTTWEIDGGGNMTLSFTSIKASLRYQDGSTYFYSYDYDNPIVTMNPEAEDRAVLTGTISGNQMTLVNASTEETIGFFYKQYECR